ncbi:MAG TPA: hypothetical protein VHT51_04665, partial [Micropepsaceae bacterium]|nr:hypothetical protein [Micropepsaceae bacterium]
MGSVWERIAGGAIMFVTLADVFLTVLYARIGSGLLANRLARVTWIAFRTVAPVFGNHRAGFLSFCGPAVLVMLVALWSSGLTVGAALIMQPSLGSAIRTMADPTPTDFLTALYVAASSVSVINTSEFFP